MHYPCTHAYMHVFQTSHAMYQVDDDGDDDVSVRAAHTHTLPYTTQHLRSRPIPATPPQLQPPRHTPKPRARHHTPRFPIPNPGTSSRAKSWVRERVRKSSTELGSQMKRSSGLGSGNTNGLLSWARISISAPRRRGRRTIAESPLEQAFPP